VTVGRYAGGFTALVVVSACMAAAALVLRRRLLPGWRGAPARLAEAVLGLALLIAILELLGALGLFRLGPIVGACVLVATALLAWAARGGATGADPGAAPGVPPPAPPLARAIALIAAGVVIAEWSVAMLSSYDVGIRGFDSLWYHLPWAASFAQTGRVTSLRFTDVEYLTAFYPATAELLHGLGIVLLGRDTLSPAINLGWLALTLLAAWCIGRPRGLQAATMTGAALALASPMMRMSQAGAAANDIAGVAFLLAAAALALQSEEPAALVLAAIAAGLAVAVKLSLLAPVLALTVGVIALKGARRAAILWIPAAAIAAAYWYVRNLIAVGNPLPWVSLGGILPTPAAPLQQGTGFSIAHYATDTGIWTRFFGPGLAAGLGRWWLVVAALALLGPVLCVLGRGQRTARMLGFVALASIAAYVITPETAAGPAGDPLGFAFNLRYAAPGLTLALTVTPLAAWLDGARARTATIVALGLLLLVTVTEARLWGGPYVPGAVLVALAAAALLGAAAAANPAPAANAAPAANPAPAANAAPAAQGTPHRGAALATAAAALALIGVAGYFGQRHYLRDRYAFHPGVSELASVWAWARGIHDARIGLAGTYGGFASYPLYGLDGSNQVQYIADRGPHGSFTPISGCRGWRAAINAGHYRYVVTTPGRDPWRPQTLYPSPEASWTTTDPAAKRILTHRARGQTIDVFELAGPLDPATCGAQTHQG
jgi:hypothetical protein